MTPCYKLKTIRPCEAALFFEFVRELCIDARDDGTSARLEFTDSTGSLYRIDLRGDRVSGLVSLDGTITVNPNQLEYHQIANFAQFCLTNDLGLRRGNIEIHGPGDLASDILSSEAHRIASRLASEMKNQN